MGQGGSKGWRVDIIDNFDPRVNGRAATKGTMFRWVSPTVGVDPIILLKQDEGFSKNWICICGDVDVVCTNVVAATDGTCPAPELAPDLGDAKNFAVLGSTTDTNTGGTVVTGDLGLSPGVAVTGFPPGTVIGTQHVTDGAAAAAQISAMAAYLNLQGRAPGTPITPGGGGLDALILPPGTYTSGSTMDLSVGATLTLDAAGDPNAVWIFQVGSALTLNNGSTVTVINGGSLANVFWQVTSSATIGTTEVGGGTVIALASVTLQTGTSWAGRVWALTGAVTMDTNAITLPAPATGCGNVDLTSAPAVIDGVTLELGDLVLIKNQTLPAENGVYVFNGVGVALTRAPDWNTPQDFVVGKEVCVGGGIINGGTKWDNTLVVVTLGVDPVEFVEVVVGDFMLRDYSNAQAPVRVASNPDTLGGTDRTLLVDTSAGAIPFVVNMPLGVNGKEFFIKDIGANAAVNNITFTANGTDAMEAGSNIISDSGCRHFQFFGGIWYILAAY